MIDSETENPLESVTYALKQYDEYLQTLTDEQKENLLAAAVHYKQKNALRYLLSKGIDPKVRDKKNKNNAFHIASDIGDPEILKLLLSYKENQISKITGLPIDICKITTKYTDDFSNLQNALDLMNERRQTALDIAVSKKNIEAMRVLLLNGAKLTSIAIDLSKENPKLMDIILYTIENNITPINSGFWTNISLMYKLRGPITPLMYAAYTCNVPLVQSLIKSKADINQQIAVKYYGDFKTQTALMFAVGKKCYDVEKILLDAGADPNVVPELGRWTTTMGDFEGEPALIVAGYNLDLPSIKILLSSPKIDINIKNYDEKTIFEVLKQLKEYRKDQLPKIQEILDYLEKFKASTV